MTAMKYCLLVAVLLLSGCVQEKSYETFHIRNWGTHEEWCEVWHRDHEVDIFPVKKEADKWACEHVR